MSEPKLLFILKRMEDYNQNSKSHVGLQTGLYNSASYMNDMLIESGIKTEMVIVNDNNDIDREVHDHKPTHVIIEALWVVPSKFAILCKLHPNVKWIIRLHSEIPFLANEGMALDWIGEYGSFKNIIIASNAPRALKDIRFYLKHKNNWTDDMAEQRVIYLPNFYSQKYIKKTFNKEKDHVDVSCFGAIRPLKNHIIQAIAAIKFGDKIGKKIKFHINSGRIEMKGEAILNNLKSLFLQLHDSGHELVIHEWTPREGFIELY